MPGPGATAMSASSLNRSKADRQKPTQPSQAAAFRQPGSGPSQGSHWVARSRGRSRRISFRSVPLCEWAVEARYVRLRDVGKAICMTEMGAKRNGCFGELQSEGLPIAGRTFTCSWRLLPCLPCFSSLLARVGNRSPSSWNSSTKSAGARSTVDFPACYPVFSAVTGKLRTQTGSRLTTRTTTYFSLWKSKWWQWVAR